MLKTLAYLYQQILLYIHIFQIMKDYPINLEKFPKCFVVLERMEEIERQPPLSPLPSLDEEIEFLLEEDEETALSVEALFRDLETDFYM